MPLYKNTDGTVPNKGLGELLKWQLTRVRRTDRDFVTPRRPNDGSALGSSSPHLTWIGHATFLARLGGKLIATDPIWSTAIHGTVRRLTSPGVALESCPPIDVVTISHSHFDHMDLPTLKRIGDGATYVVPKDNAAVLKGAGLTKVVELDWWEAHEIDGVKITLVPAQHWSMRAPWDRNKRLWGGFVYESAEGSAYHAGDTALSESMFREIGARFPKLDWAMLPVGAYEPVWFMREQHMGPEEACRAFELLGARTLVAMHWGTFRLTDEPLGEPPERVRAYWRDHALDEGRLWVLDIGETRPLAR